MCAIKLPDWKSSFDQCESFVLKKNSALLLLLFQVYVLGVGINRLAALKFNGCINMYCCSRGIPWSANNKNNNKLETGSNATKRNSSSSQFL